MSFLYENPVAMSTHIFQIVVSKYNFSIRGNRDPLRNGLILGYEMYKVSLGYLILLEGKEAM